MTSSNTSHLKSRVQLERHSKGQFLKFNRIYYLPTGKGRRIAKIPRPFFLRSTASVSTNAYSEMFCRRKT